VTDHPTRRRQRSAIRSASSVPRLITFLASPSNITGAEYIVDGGTYKGA
jgi:hypothetical protein